MAPTKIKTPETNDQSDLRTGREKCLISEKYNNNWFHKFTNGKSDYLERDSQNMTVE